MSAIFRPFQWFYHEFGVESISQTGRNAWIIILTRTLRMVAYGTSQVILAIFFSALEFSDHQIGIFMTLTLLGDVFLGTFLTLISDRVGRRKVLIGGSFLMVLSGVVFATLERFWILLLAAILGVISVTGGDFGPFRSIEESVLSQLTTPETRADVLAWYVTTSTLGSSLGSEASGRIVHYLQSLEGWTPVDSYHSLFWIYAVMGLTNAVLFLALSDECELRTEDIYSQIPQDDTEPNANQPSEVPDLPQKDWKAKTKSWLTDHFSQISAPTRAVMYKLWFLLAIDSLADGMVPLSLTNYYMDIKFHPTKATLGDVTSASYFLAAVGAVFAGPLARKIGLINTMVFTHVPSSTAVLLFPFPPVFWLTAALLLVRMWLNNMDQAPRTAFIAAVVRSEERTSVMGITSMVRTLAAMAGPTLTGVLAARKHFWVAFVLAGACRLVYDFGLYAMFVNMKLYQHEKGVGGLPNGHGPLPGRDEEETEMELHSLADSDSEEEAMK